MRKKSKISRVVLSVLGVFLLIGAVGTITAGALTDWTYNFNDPFKDIVIESQEFTYDGSEKTLDVKIPKNASYELVITNEKGEIVDECKDLGVYTFIYKIKIDSLTKQYVAKLTIKDNATISSRFIENGVSLHRANAYDEGSDSVIEVRYSVNPEGVDQDIELAEVVYAPDDQCSTDNDDDYMANTGLASSFIIVDIDTSEQIIKITNLGKKEFNHEINVTVKSVVDENVTATIKVGYKRRFNPTSEKLAELSSRYGDYFNGISDIHIKLEDLNSNLFPGVMLAESPTLTKFTVDSGQVKLGSTSYSEVNLVQYFNGLSQSIISNVSNNRGTTKKWNGSDFSLSLSNYDDIFTDSRLLTTAWDGTDGKDAILKYILDNVFNVDLNSSQFRTNLVSMFVDKQAGYSLGTWYDYFINQQNPLIGSNQPLFVIPTALLTINFGDAGSIPYQEFFVNHSIDGVIKIYLDASLDTTINLEDSEVAF